MGVRPRVKAAIPSVRHTVRTQSIDDLYFCPVEAVKPSVCIRDLIISIGYITPHSCARMSLEQRLGRPKAKTTHSIPGSRTVQDGVHGAELVSLDAFLGHLALHELFVREEIHAVAGSLADERHALTLEHPRDTVCGVYFLNRVKRALVLWLDGRLRLQT